MIAAKMRLCRHKARLSQLEVAKILKIPSATYANWELGRAEPPASMISEIAEALQTSPNVLFGFSEDTTVSVLDTLTLDETKLIATYRGVNERGKEALIQTSKLILNYGPFRVKEK